jgi:uncharacterized protein YggU (UPF0235/DUF167 family)
MNNASKGTLMGCGKPHHIPREGISFIQDSRLLADRLGLPRRDITLLRGATAREKQIAIAGQTGESVRRRLRLDPA